MTVVVADRERRRLLSGRRAGLLAAVVIPLAFAGLTLAAVGDPAAGIERVPVALVNADEMITQVDEETGEESFVLAGRQLVTELTAPDSQANFDWQLSNTDDAAAKLAYGQVYAVLTIPADFSESILSIQSDEPQQAQIEIRTDDSHSYVAGPVAEALGASIVRVFGQEITESFIVNVFDQVGEAFTEAADGAAQLADGTEELADGAGDFAAGVGQYTGGVAEFAGGVQGFAGGVREYAQGVRDYAAGVEQLAGGASGLDQLVDSVGGYADGVSQLSAGIAQTVQALQLDPADPALLGQLAYLSGQLEEAAAGGQQLALGTAQGIGELQEGAQQLAAGGQQLVEGAKQLRSGAIQISDGASQVAAGGGPLAEGADQLADGAGELASGSRDFAEGMGEGAGSFSDQEAAERLAAVVSDPVGYQVATDHSASGTSAAMATVLVPLAAWIGALVVFLAVPPFRVRSLASSASSLRILLGGLARAGAVAAVQAVLLALVLHIVGGVGWELLPQTLVYLLLLGAVFTGFHAALVAAFGRAGLVGSFLLLAVQVAANGAVLPVELLAPGAALVSPYLPLSWASTGLQQILTSGSAALTTGSAIALLLFGAASIVVAGLALRRTRRSAVLSLLAPA